MYKQITVAIKRQLYCQYQIAILKFMITKIAFQLPSKKILRERFLPWSCKSPVYHKFCTILTLNYVTIILVWYFFSSLQLGWLGALLRKWFTLSSWAGWAAVCWLWGRFFFLSSEVGPLTVLSFLTSAGDIFGINVFSVFCLLFAFFNEKKQLCHILYENLISRFQTNF